MAEGFEIREGFVTFEYRGEGYVARQSSYKKII
jgi:hypothetical protein